MAHLLEDVDLAGDAFHVAFIFDFVLFEDFDCDHFVGNCVSADPHLAERTLPE